MEVADDSIGHDDAGMGITVGIPAFGARGFRMLFLAVGNSRFDYVGMRGIRV